MSYFRFDKALMNNLEEALPQYTKISRFVGYTRAKLR